LPYFAVPHPTVNVTFLYPGTVPYAGNNVNLKCDTILKGGVTNSHVMVNNTWTRNGTAFSGVDGRIKLITQTPSVNGTVHSVLLVFSPLSSSEDNGTYGCMVTLTSKQQGIVTSTEGSGSSVTLAVRGNILLQEW